MTDLREMTLEEWRQKEMHDHNNPDQAEPIEDLEAWDVNHRLANMLPWEVAHFGELIVTHVQASTDANYEIRHRGVHTLCRRMNFERARAYILTFGTVDI